MMNGFHEEIKEKKNDIISLLSPKASERFLLICIYSIYNLYLSIFINISEIHHVL